MPLLWVKHHPLFRKQPWEREHVITTILILSLLDKDKKRMLGPGESGHLEVEGVCWKNRNKQNRKGNCNVTPAPFLLAVQCGCHFQPAGWSPLPPSHSAPGLCSTLHPLQPQQEAPTCPSGTLQGRKEPLPAWGDHRVLCGQVGIECPGQRRLRRGTQ